MSTHLLIQWLDPDIAKADFAAVVLEENATRFADVIVQVAAGNLVEITIGHFLAVLNDVNRVRKLSFFEGFADEKNIILTIFDH